MIQFRPGALWCRAVFFILIIYVYQLAWLQRDLSYVPKGSKVFVNMHGAGWNIVSDYSNMKNAADLEEILRDYDVHVYCGHTHFFQNREVNDNLYQHNVGAACGCWWKGLVNQCGTPMGYLITEVVGNDISWLYKTVRRGLHHQMRIYTVGEDSNQPQYVVVNAWDVDSQSSVEWFEDGQPMGPMEQFDGIDHDALVLKQTKASATKRTPHLFRALPSDQAREVTIVLTNRFGHKYSQTVKIPH